MEEDCGGGGGSHSSGGGGGSGFGYMNVPTSPFVYMSNSPLHDINRFLAEQNNFSNQNGSDLTFLNNKNDNSISYNFFQGQNNFSSQNPSNPTILDNKNVYNCEFSSSHPFSSGATNRSFSSAGLFSTRSGSIDLGVGINKNFADEGIQKWPKELKRSFEGPAKEESGSRKESKPKNKEPKTEKGIPKGFIKGQWTEEEDRKLISLVIKNGELRWAEIAEEMVGRAGKQCRERWQNHLRPELKKTLWTAEEEKMLVEAHQIVGNKWAEIAKRIPGRSENSIKNHWNATKRRHLAKGQTVKRNRKNQKQPRPTFLEDYIKTLISNSNDQNPSSTSTDNNPDTPEPPEFPDDLLPDHVRELFADIYEPMSLDYSPLFPIEANSNLRIEEPQPYSDPYFSYLLEGNSNYFPNNEAEQFDPYSNFCSSFLVEENSGVQREEVQRDDIYPCSNLSFSSWLNGGSDGTSNSTSVPSSSSNYNFGDGANFGFNEKQEGGSSSSQKGEMDLMEMARFHFPNNNI